MSVDALRLQREGGQLTLTLARPERGNALSPDLVEPLLAAVLQANADASLHSLLLRAEGPGGMRGDAKFTYPPSDPQYQMVLEHVGGLEPGATKSVPPWPEK